MIVKDLDPFLGGTPQIRSGRRAEEQMAHYLKRAYGTSKDVFILNGLRLMADGEAAQIDHLVICRWGFIIVESKSVTQVVSVNEHGEWIRISGNRRQGMPSPIEQALRQAAFLHSYLAPHRAELLNAGTISKALGLLSPERADAIREGIRMWFGVTTFAGVAQELLVAISDEAIIDRPAKLELPEVVKADQVPGKIKTILGRYRKANSLLTLRANPFDTADVVSELSRGEMQRVAQFLVTHNQPLPDSASLLPVIAPTQNNNPTPCATCGELVDTRVEKFCKDRPARFNGKVFCRVHQQ
jgi:hypothetical protein